jgi:hypothetical protein
MPLGLWQAREWSEVISKANYQSKFKKLAITEKTFASVIPIHPFS